jgi:pancreatic triacylglycerol lipase
MNTLRVVLSILVICLLGNAQALLDVCYGELGCFTVRWPFSGVLARPIALLPESPTKIATTFFLYTRETVNNPTTISYNVNNPNYKINAETKFIIPGFLHHGTKQWILDIKNALLRVGDYNVIFVDWSKGNKLPYIQATANTQVVGAEIARLVNTLITSHGISADNFHMIGYSLGSHIAGYAGSRISGLGRITGLDPAGPYFENTDNIVRLDAGDAKFVDVIHSDGASTLEIGLGLLQRSGHADFYPNGGKEQPKCPGPSDKFWGAILNLFTFDLTNVEKAVGCSHKAAVNFFLDSIENTACKYTAYQCANKKEFDAGNCISCTAKGCNTMGFWASPNRDLGALYFSTQNADAYPYCYQHYQVKLNSNSIFGQTQARGRFTISFNAESGTTETLTLDNDNHNFYPGQTFKTVLGSTRNVGTKITSATLSYQKTNNILIALFYQNSWSFKSIEVIHGDSQQYTKLCPDQTYINSGSPITFRKC